MINHLTSIFLQHVPVVESGGCVFEMVVSSPFWLVESSSKDGMGHQFTPFSAKKAFATLEVCFGSLSCIKMVTFLILWVLKGRQESYL